MRKNFRLLSILLALIIAVGTLPALMLPTFGASDDINAPTVISAENIGIGNGDFSTTSGSYPASVDNWTGTLLGHSGEGSIIKGIVDLNPTALRDANVDNKLGLNKSDALNEPRYTFAGNSDTPRTMFGNKNDPVFSNYDSKALMINSPDTRVAYGYKSSSLSLSPNRYYMFSVWVMTGSFDENSGAFIRLDGDGVNMMFGPINTSARTASQDLGWERYVFYVESSSYKTLSVQLSLQLGDFYQTTTNGTLEKHVSETKGIVFFDAVSAHSIPKTMFDAGTSNYDPNNNRTDNRRVYSAKTPVAGFFTDENNANYVAEYFRDWVRPEFNTFLTRAGYINIYDFAEDKAFFELGEKTENPSSPFGETSVFVINNTAPSRFTIKSPSFVIERHRRYRLSVWYKADNVSGNATARLSYYNPSTDKDVDFDVSCTGAGEVYHSGWTEAVFYITGSSFNNQEVWLQLMLGTTSAPASGRVYFSTVSLEEVLPEDIENNSSNGTSVTFESFSPTIPNGNFNMAGSYEEFKFPLKAKDWESNFAGNNELSRPGVKELSDEKLITGIIGVDKEHFDAHKSDYGEGIVNPTSGYSASRNVLYIYNKAETAYGYISPSITLESGVSIITVRLAAQITSQKGGANLVLRQGNSVLATIENIRETTFTDYRFVVDAGSESRTVNVEIWLGLSDGKENDTKLASGHVFVDNIQSAAGTAENYTIAKHSLNTARFSYASETFEAFDHSETTFAKTPFTWTKGYGTFANHGGAADIATVGIFDARDIMPGSALDHVGFTHGNNDNPYVMMLHNPEPTSVYVKSDLSYSLKTTDSSKYYRITFSVQTLNIPVENENLGAMIKLVGVKNGVFKAINTERNLRPNEENGFKDYSFYIEMADSDFDVSFELWLGNDEKMEYFTSGYAFFDGITVENITEQDFADGVRLLDEEAELEDDEKTVFNVIKILMGDNTDTTETENEEKPDFPWWGLPSILFGIAILIALGGALIQRIAPKIKRSIKRKRAVAYDREATLEKIHAKNVDMLRRRQLEQLESEYSDDDEDEMSEEELLSGESPEIEESEEVPDAPATDETQYDDHIVIEEPVVIEEKPIKQKTPKARKPKDDMDVFDDFDD